MLLKGAQEKALAAISCKVCQVIRGKYSYTSFPEYLLFFIHINDILKIFSKQKTFLHRCVL